MTTLLPVIDSLGAMPELRPSDAVNLAVERVTCLECGGTGETPGRPKCRECRGRGHVSAPTGREHLSYSMITTLTACPQKYGLNYDDRLELVARPKAFTMGDAFQKGIEDGDPDAAAERLLELVHPRNQHEEDQLRIDATTVRAAGRLYLEKWPAPTMPCPGFEILPPELWQGDGPVPLAPCDGLGCPTCDGAGEVVTQTREYEYRVRLRSPWTGAWSQTFDLLGYADGLDEHDDRFTLIENKFVGQITEVGIKKLPLDRQVGLGAYGVWRATGKPVLKVQYRYVRKPSIGQKKGRETKTKGIVGAETVDQFCERLEGDYQERPEFYAVQETLFRTDADLVRTEAELWEWAEDIRKARRRRLYTRTTSHCHDYGGCAFIPLCTGDPDGPSLFRTRPVRAIPKPTIEETDANAAA